MRDKNIETLIIRNNMELCVRAFSCELPYSESENMIERILADPRASHKFATISHRLNPHYKISPNCLLFDADQDARSGRFTRQNRQVKFRQILVID